SSPANVRGRPTTNDSTSTPSSARRQAATPSPSLLPRGTEVNGKAIERASSLLASPMRTEPKSTPTTITSRLRGRAREALREERQHVREADLRHVEVRIEAGHQPEREHGRALDVEPLVGVVDRAHQRAELLPLELRVGEALELLLARAHQRARRARLELEELLEVDLHRALEELPVAVDRDEADALDAAHGERVVLL